MKKVSWHKTTPKIYTKLHRRFTNCDVRPGLADEIGSTDQSGGCVPWRSERRANPFHSLDAPDVLDRCRAEHFVLDVLLPGWISPRIAERLRHAALRQWGDWKSVERTPRSSRHLQTLPICLRRQNAPGCRRSRLIRFSLESKPAFAVRPLLQRCAASMLRLWWTKRKIGIVRLQGNLLLGFLFRALV